MSLDRQLRRWEDAGVIDATTRARIATFEQRERRPVMLYALGALGGGTMALGFVSLVAANWDAITPTAKLAGDLLLGVALAFAVFRAVDRENHWWTEVSITVFYGFTLASLALVAQLYQLNGATYQLLLAWAAATLPLVLLGRSRYLAALVTAALWATHGLTLQAFVDYLDHTGALTATAKANVIVTLVFASVFAYVVVARVPWLARQRPEYAATMTTLAWTAVFVMGFGLQAVWYTRIGADDTLGWGLVTTMLVAAAVIAALPRLYPTLRGPARDGLRCIVGFAWISLVLAVGVAHDGHPIVGALLQVAWLAMFAWTAVQLGMLRVFNVVTALIALRVLAIYFEVFGSLLDTGLGLVSGGALTLLLAWLWRRNTQSLAATLALPAKGGAPRDPA